MAQLQEVGGLWSLPICLPSLSAYARNWDLLTTGNVERVPKSCIKHPQHSVFPLTLQPAAWCMHTFLPLPLWEDQRSVVMCMGWAGRRVGSFGAFWDIAALGNTDNSCSSVMGLCDEPHSACKGILLSAFVWGPSLARDPAVQSQCLDLYSGNFKHFIHKLQLAEGCYY